MRPSSGHCFRAMRGLFNSMSSAFTFPVNSEFGGLLDTCLESRMSRRECPLDTCLDSTLLSGTPKTAQRVSGSLTESVFQKPEHGSRHVSRKLAVQARSF